MGRSELGEAIGFITSSTTALVDGTELFALAESLHRLAVDLRARTDKIPGETSPSARAKPRRRR